MKIIALTSRAQRLAAVCALQAAFTQKLSLAISATTSDFWIVCGLQGR